MCYCLLHRSNRPGGDQQHASGEFIRRCGLCQEADMVLRKSRVMIYIISMPNSKLFLVSPLYILRHH